MKTRAPMDSLSHMRGALTFSASLVQFDRNRSVNTTAYMGLILLQGSVYPKQRRCIPKSAKKFNEYSVGAPTLSSNINVH
jgi:hypothetical protein